jgi:hypothetical protein
VVVVDDLGEHRSASLGVALERRGAGAARWSVPGRGPERGRRLPERSSSTAWRKLTPWVRITQSMTDPPAWHAPRQCHRFLAGLTTSEGSSVVVERAAAHQVRPGLLELHPGAATRASQVHLLLQPLDLLVGDTGHMALSRQNGSWDGAPASPHLGCNCVGPNWAVIGASRRSREASSGRCRAASTWGEDRVLRAVPVLSGVRAATSATTRRRPRRAAPWRQPAEGRSFWPWKAAWAATTWGLTRVPMRVST